MLLKTARLLTSFSNIMSKGNSRLKNAAPISRVRSASPSVRKSMSSDPQITPITIRLAESNPGAHRQSEGHPSILILLLLIGLPFQLFGTTFAAIYFLNLHLSGVAAQKYPHLSPRQNR